MMMQMHPCRFEMREPFAWDGHATLAGSMARSSARGMQRIVHEHLSPGPVPARSSMEFISAACRRGTEVCGAVLSERSKDGERHGFVLAVASSNAGFALAASPDSLTLAARRLVQGQSEAEA